MKNQYLSKIYYNISHRAGFTGKQPLIDAVRKKYTANEVENWLQHQDSYTLHRPIRKRFPRNRYVVYRINELWEYDLWDMTGLSKYNDGINYILVVIDVFSKKVHARLLKRKTPTCVIPAFKSIFKHAKPKVLRSDKGLEFTAKQVKDFFKSEDIKFVTSNNPDVKCGVIERLIRSLKTRMWRYLTYKNTYKYIDILQDLVKAYNNSKHRSIKMAPNQVTVENSFDVWMNLYNKPVKIKKPKFNVGDYVRISKEKGKFEKGYETNWCEEVFIIKNSFSFPQPLYTLADLNNAPIKGMFYEFELQKVIIKPDKVYKIDKILDTKGKGASKRLLVKWRGYSDDYNSWISVRDVKPLT